MDKYPFTPALLAAFPEELADLFRELEEALLVEICTRLNLAGQLNEVTVQSIRALRAHGIDLKDIKKAIQKATNTGTDEINRLFDDVVERNRQYYSEVIDLAGLTQPDTLLNETDIAAITEQCQREYGNITRSMGFLVDSGRTMLEPAKAYQWALDSAALQIQSGAVSYNEAIKGAVKQLAESGLKTVNYENGHVDSVDVAVRRAVMTGVNQLNRQYTEQSMDYLETDLVEVSAHIGARNVDGPNGWENHERWQGGIYRWAAYQKRYPNASAGEYRDFEKTCGYGDVTGILGANCRHSYSPFVEGVMEPTYTQADLDRLKGENNKVTYDGRTYDGYQATQMQRRLERTIRKQKRLVNAYKAAGLTEDAQAANIKLRRLNQKYSEFSKAAGLPEQTERKNVLYADETPTMRASTGPSMVASAPNTAQKYADVTAQWRETATPNSHVVQDAQEYTKNGVTYQVDGHNVVLDYSAHEKEIAELLEREFGGELYMVPRVNNPQGVSTPDYLFRGVEYDLKTIGENAGENTIFNRVKKAKGQATGFVIDTTNSGLDSDKVSAQIHKLFNRVDTAWLDQVIIVHGGEIVRVVKRT